MKTPLLWDPDSRPDFLGSSESRGPTKSLTRGRLPSSSATFLASGWSFLPAGTGALGPLEGTEPVTFLKPRRGAGCANPPQAPGKEGLFRPQNSKVPWCSTAGSQAGT